MKFTLIVTALLCSAVAWSEVLSYKDFPTPPRSGTPQVMIPGKTVSYAGFYIEPASGTEWGIAPGQQRENFAFWAIVDAKNILHTTIAMVALSPQLSEQYLKKLSLETLKTQISKKFSDHIGSRFQNIKVSSQITSVNGVMFAEVCGTALDKNSKLSKKPFRLYTKILAAITPDGRVFTISISERIPDPDGKVDLHAVETFIKSVHLGQPQK